MMWDKKYEEIEEFIMSIPRFSQKSSFEETDDFYTFLGRPGENKKILHVAGTNGKGSVCAYMNQVLLSQKVSTGMFTSPHLVSLRERIKVNGKMISEKEMEKSFKKLGHAIDEYKQKKNREDYFPSFFEFMFFMAMLHFKEQSAEVIILETGMGGRLDATNVIRATGVCVITKIGLDHTEYLGDTITKIAQEKAGIIKPGCKVIYSDNRQESNEIIEQKSQDTGVLCKSVTKYENEKIRFGDKTIDFSFYSRYYGYVPLTINTTALYQVENVCLALTALEESDIFISRKSMKEGVGICRWAARMEEILPGVYLDGAHNEDGIEAFVRSASLKKCMGKRYLLFSAVADKEYRLMKESLCNSGLFDEIYAVPIHNKRGLSKLVLKDIFSGEKVRILDSAAEGLKEILAKKREEDLVYIAGSLYLAGEIKEVWE